MHKHFLTKQELVDQFPDSNLDNDFNPRKKTPHFYVPLVTLSKIELSDTAVDINLYNHMGALILTISPWESRDEIAKYIADRYLEATGINITPKK